MTFDAILLLGFGGPEGPAEVRPFLERIAAGRGIPVERLAEVERRYRALGGVSPINAQNRALASALADALAARGRPLPVALAHRNSAPFIGDALAALARELQGETRSGGMGSGGMRSGGAGPDGVESRGVGTGEAGIRRILAVATSAYASYSSCRQYREDVGTALAERAGPDAGAQAAHLDPTMPAPAPPPGAGTGRGERPVWDADALAERPEPDAGAVPTERPVLDVVKLPPFAGMPGLAEATADLLAPVLAEPGRRPTVLFSTHSLPVTMARTSGPESGWPDADSHGRADSASSGQPPEGPGSARPASTAAPGVGSAASGTYVTQHLTLAEAALARASELAGVEVPPWRLVFQSRSGPPSVPWLQPDIGEALAQLAADGVQDVVVVPIGFLSDHVEVIWDLDTEAAATARRLGLRFTRVATVGTHPAFVGGLADLIVALDAAATRPPEPGEFCFAGCCPAPPRRQERPATATAQPDGSAPAPNPAPSPGTALSPAPNPAPSPGAAPSPSPDPAPSPDPVAASAAPAGGRPVIEGVYP